MKTNIIKIILTLFFALVLFYFMLPPLNISTPIFFAYFFMVILFHIVLSLVFATTNLEKLIVGKVKFDKSSTIVLLCGIGVLGLLLVINLINSPLFMSKSYYERIKVDENGDFLKDVKEVDLNRLPLVDKDSSLKLGDRVMGQMPELVSQFYVSDVYTQINYNNDIVRVTPLEYSGFIKYLTNRKDGIKGYITVNSVTGEAKLAKLDKGMKYAPSAYFFEDLHRKLRFTYPTTIFGQANFEIDNEGNPYWIIPTLKYTGIGLKEEVSGVVIFNPVNGESKKYKVEEVPTWVDHVYSSQLIIEQVDDWGQYKNGFFNSVFSQKNVVMTTSGYNYLVMNDDIYLYTGITSVISDESNVGFVLTNLRTKETVFYPVSGAEEFSAMASAKGQVQQMNYNPTFPLLINLNNKPTYVLSLKDAAGLVKMYAFIDVVNYQKVVVTDANEGIEKAAANYLGNDGYINSTDVKTKTITIDSINNAVIDGTTYYYIKDTETNIYRANIKTNEQILIFLKPQTSVNISYKESNKDITKIEYAN